MSLQNAVLFPHGVLPLYIFEPRYRQMVAETLEGDRIFGIATIDPKAGDDSGEEPVFPIVGVGYIKFERTNEDGTSNLILEGFCRAKVLRIAQECPYRRLSVEPIHSIPAQNEKKVRSLRKSIVNQLIVLRDYNFDVPEKILRFLESKCDEVFCFMVANTWCEAVQDRIQLLGEPSIEVIYQNLDKILAAEIKKRSIFKKLQGDLGEEDISWN